MRPLQAQLRSGSRAQVEGVAPDWELEWREAEAADRAEPARAGRKGTGRALVLLAPVGALAAALPSIFPLTPSFSASDAVAAVVAAAVTAVVAVSIVPTAARLARRLPRAGAGDALVFTVAALSAGAAAIHFAVAKMHFDEYTLFGVFFVLSGIAQLGWAVLVLIRPRRSLLSLGVVGNLAIAALWAVDRIWGLPLGPTPWKPDPVGFGDSVTSGFEVLLVAGCVVLLVKHQPLFRRRAIVLPVTFAVVALTALSLLSVIGVGASFLTRTQ